MMSNQGMYLFIDFYGTLVDTGDSSIRATQAILDRLGIKIPARDFYDHWKSAYENLCRGPFALEEEIFRKGFSQTLTAFGMRAIDDNCDELFQEVRKRKPFPEAVSAVSSLADHFKIVIASNSDRAPLLACLEPFEPYIHGVVTSEDVSAYKPSGDFYTRLLDRVGCNADQVIFVGDSVVNDYDGPRSHGMTAYRVDRNLNKPESGDLVFPNLEAVAECIISELAS